MTGGAGDFRGLAGGAGKINVLVTLCVVNKVVLLVLLFLLLPFATRISFSGRFLIGVGYLKVALCGFVPSRRRRGRGPRAASGRGDISGRGRGKAFRELGRGRNFGNTMGRLFALFGSVLETAGGRLLGVGFHGIGISLVIIKDSTSVATIRCNTIYNVICPIVSFVSRGLSMGLGGVGIRTNFGRTRDGFNFSISVGTGSILLLVVTIGTLGRCGGFDMEGRLR